MEKTGLSQGVTWRMSLDWEVLGLTNQVRCQCPLSINLGLTRMHREMNSEATSSGSPLRAAVPPKRAKVTQKVQTNQTIQDLDEMNDQLRSTKKELDDMTKTMLAMEEDRDMWRKLFEDCNKKTGSRDRTLKAGIQRAIGTRRR